ncbi:MAG TPA: endonuclease Q family protein [bacterium]|nr:endonuclease Q family protein [bacterium]
MHIAADLHIHSRYSRATSKGLDVAELACWARRKGVSILGTGDFTHPAWREEIRSKLIEDGSGLLRLRPGSALPTHQTDTSQIGMFGHAEAQERSDADFIVSDVRFLLSSELSTIYSHNGKTRKIHHVFLAPDLATADAISEALIKKKANIFSDGRPILGLTSEELCDLVFSINPDCQLIPAHIWTPWFSVFGSKSGYDSLEECYGSFTKKILALETGLSSDPPMNWRWSYLDGYTLVSNSDAHSANKIARECNVFEVAAGADLSYRMLADMIQTGDPDVFRYSVEFYPEEGKYHWDGHRACQVRWKPEETAAHAGICPVCGQEVTIGVSNRVNELADRPEGYTPTKRVPVKHVVPLEEILASVLESGRTSKKVQGVYDALVDEIGSELAVLISTDVQEISAFSGERIGRAVELMRQGKVNVNPGYDGEFGRVEVAI